MTIRLEDQVAVVTGGSRGIGAATVRLFAEAHANVVFSYRRAAQSARELIRECRSLPGERIAVRAEASRMSDARKLIETAARRFGRIDILVANAGIWNAKPAPIERMSEQQWDEMIAVNLKGVFAAIRAAVPRMIPRRCGRIIVVS